MLNVTINTTTTHLVKEATPACLITNEFFITTIRGRAALLVAGEVEQRVLVRAELRLDGSAAPRVDPNRCDVRRKEAFT